MPDMLQLPLLTMSAEALLNILKSPFFLVTDYKIDAVEQILPILEVVARESRPFVIVAEDIEGQALAALIMNAMRGTMKIAAVKAPRYGEERRGHSQGSCNICGRFSFLARGLKLKDKARASGALPSLLRLQR
jgi:chaperonin GroEL